MGELCALQINSQLHSDQLLCLAHSTQSCIKGGQHAADCSRSTATERQSLLPHTRSCVEQPVCIITLLSVFLIPWIESFLSYVTCPYTMPCVMMEAMYNFSTIVVGRFISKWVLLCYFSVTCFTFFCPSSSSYILYFDFLVAAHFHITCVLERSKFITCPRLPYYLQGQQLNTNWEQVVDFSP